MAVILDRATSVRRSAPTWAAFVAAQRDVALAARNARRIEARDPSRRVLPADHPDAILAREGRTDANGYRWTTTIARRPGIGQDGVMYLAPLRIGAGTLTIGNGTLADTSAGAVVYRAARREAIRARDYVATARRAEALAESVVYGCILAQPFATLTRHRRVPTVPGLIVPDGYRQRVRTALADIGERIVLPARTIRVIGTSFARSQNRAARVMVERPREARRQREHRAAETPEQRRARLDADKARRATRVANETAEQRTARLANQRERAAKARAARKQNGSK